MYAKYKSKYPNARFAVHASPDAVLIARPTGRVVASIAANVVLIAVLAAVPAALVAFGFPAFAAMFAPWLIVAVGMSVGNIVQDVRSRAGEWVTAAEIAVEFGSHRVVASASEVAAVYVLEPPRGSARVTLLCRNGATLLFAPELPAPQAEAAAVAVAAVLNVTHLPTASSPHTLAAVEAAALHAWLDEPDEFDELDEQAGTADGYGWRGQRAYDPYPAHPVVALARFALEA